MTLDGGITRCAEAIVGVTFSASDEGGVMRTFSCYHCQKKSRFLKQKQQREVYAELKTLAGGSFGDETRTYLCEFCDQENRITQPAGAWFVIDTGS